MGAGEGKGNAGKISWELVKRSEMLVRPDGSWLR